MKIVFSGGGTLGPVTPLLAIFEITRAAHPSFKFLWIGTKNGPEIALVKEAGIPFRAIAVGKLRRYFSVSNLTDIIRVIKGFFESFFILWKENPDVCVSAGGFVSVPVHIAAWFLGIPTWLHQQDVEVGLASRVMAPFARFITTALEKNTKAFSSKKTRWLGNPIRARLLDSTREIAIKKFGLNGSLPVVFVTGGGTGSAKINAMVAEAVPNLSGVCEIIHLTGRGRGGDAAKRVAELFQIYHTYEFFTDEMKDAYAAADIVVSRGGFGTLTEIAAWKKPAILIPKPGHQEKNVNFIAKEGAAIFLDERISAGNDLAASIKELLASPKDIKKMGEHFSKIFQPAKAEEVLLVVRSFIS